MNPMPRPPALQRLFFGLLVAAATPLAVLQVINRTALPFDATFDLAPDDIQGDLVDGEVAAG